ncbi:AAA family ATPase [Tolypothrix sp. PCC 7910]|uniref:TniB family NTP-binding protein n=1 Tax=Tolypothrix sp. PCC 7910 TaxID=2099387 RepID=UPI0014278A5E|nr:TniB family NTP-binding protein [Tolypothrix sp. PCC 7910]QIR40302.1 AAA family ATPase [Tolypothrix sp. PCC 7910]
MTEISANKKKIQSDFEQLFINYIFPTRQLRLLYEWLEVQRQSRHNNLIIGETLIGKSTACQIYAYQNKLQHLKDNSNIVPIVYIVPPFGGGTKDIFLAIIESLDSTSIDLHLANLREKARYLLKDCGVEMLIIDDTAHYRNKVFTDILSICEPMNIAVILVGRQTLYSYIYGNRNLNPRFTNIYRFGNLQTEEIKQIITFWEKNVPKLSEASNLTSEPMFNIVNQTIKGNIGRLNRIFKALAIQAWQDGLKSIDVDILKKVVQCYMR